ncbi:MAG: hypothetical protein HQ541_05985 [Mariniphaga sp.]|nr:hypothetical protein [Mariniphaga sp.]
MKQIVKTFLGLVLVISVISPTKILGQSEEAYSDLLFTIPEVALLDVEPVGISNITLVLTGNTEAGLPISASDASNNNLWINYTSSLATGSPNRSVSVQVASGSIPSGVALSLYASSDSGNGDGSMGSPTGTLNVTNSPQVLISGIGRCYTGNGQNRGHRLNYSLSISDYNELNFIESATIQIAFTLSDN